MYIMPTNLFTLQGIAAVSAGNRFSSALGRTADLYTWGLGVCLGVGAEDEAKRKGLDELLVEVRERERKRERVCVCVCVCARARALVRMRQSGKVWMSCWSR